MRTASASTTAAWRRRASSSATRTAPLPAFRSRTGRSRAVVSGTSAGGAATSGTQHVEDHLTDPAKVYHAPEAVAGGDEGAARADVFSLGAIAYHILAGRPPVSQPARPAKPAARGQRAPCSLAR